ncbi:hypothetical protein PoMZ_13715 [Pyricularia oryzae]|uniref:Secreted protein n=1 Tax=Pyricularia oryzae TaxID=318829 RepID=A0A4P7NW27_PYROR|nr:hypothetical protein PoMZ_13715 [Pyricularia oryzae]
MGCGPRLLFIQLLQSATFPICYSEFLRPILEDRVRGGRSALHNHALDEASSPSCGLNGHKDGALIW